MVAVIRVPPSKEVATMLGKLFNVSQVVGGLEEAEVICASASVSCPRTSTTALATKLVYCIL